MDALTELKEKYKLGLLSQTEFLLIGVALFCIGLVIGMIFSPKGSRAYGSNNGNNNSSNGNNNSAGAEKKEEEENE